MAHSAGGPDGFMEEEVRVMVADMNTRPAALILTYGQEHALYLYSAAIACTLLPLALSIPRRLFEGTVNDLVQVQPYISSFKDGDCRSGCG